MLAAPILPTSNIIGNRDLAQYRPAKDLEAFNALLPPAIEFVEGSSSGLIALGEGKYQAINDAPASSRLEADASSSLPQAPSSSKPSKQASTLSTGGLPSALYSRHIDVTWPPNLVKGCGLVNTGNTCFLNSALQCLLHTPPLLHVLEEHSKTDPCLVPKNTFCMTCSMRQLMKSCYGSNHSMVPYVIITKLQYIAKHMRRGRQEDSHEFLRYAIDGLQKSAITGYPQKIDHKLAETSWVHKIWGGRLRSRVTCLSCQYNSDTFDSILDLSVDIYGVHTLKDALRKFVAVDHLKGADKYKCEKCKKHVTANKQFTIHEAPTVLTVHLKRFSPMGRKIGHPIRYEEHLSLQPVMSEGQYGPTYSLFGIISHAGGGPNSGHYYAHIKDAKGQWFEMNDESVTHTSTAPLGMKNAYMLFYIREKGQALEAAVASTNKENPTVQRSPIIANMKRRKRVDSDDEDGDDSTPPAKSKSFIGPRLPSPMAAERSMRVNSDPQAELLQRKIAQKSAAPLASPTRPSPALQSLAQYSDDEDDDMGEKVNQSEAATLLPSVAEPFSPSVEPLSTSDFPRQPAPVVAPVPTSSFYGTPANKTSMSDRKRKSPEPEEQESSLRDYARQPLGYSTSPRRHSHKRFASNPYSSRLSGGNNLRSSSSPVVQNRYGKRNNKNFNRRSRHS